MISVWVGYALKVLMPRGDPLNISFIRRLIPFFVNSFGFNINSTNSWFPLNFLDFLSVFNKNLFLNSYYLNNCNLLYVCVNVICTVEMGMRQKLDINGLIFQKKSLHLVPDARYPNFLNKNMSTLLVGYLSPFLRR